MTQLKAFMVATIGTKQNMDIDLEAEIKSNLRRSFSKATFMGSTKTTFEKRVAHLEAIERHSDSQAAACRDSFAMKAIGRQMIMKNYSAGAAPLIKSNFRKPHFLPKLLGLALN